MLNKFFNLMASIGRRQLLVLVGALLIMLGGLVLLGWALQSSALVRVLPGFTPMVVNSALSFILAGGVLIVPLSDRVRYRRVTTIIGAALVLLATLVLLERLLMLELGIDWRSLHAALDKDNLSPGRMPTGTAIAFLMSGCVLILLTRAHRPWAQAVVRLLTLGVGAVGLFGLVGYLVKAKLLFPHYPFAGIAMHTAVGMLLLSVGLQSTWQRFDWARKPRFVRQDDQITFVGASVLALVTLAAGIASFAVLQDRVLGLVSNTVGTTRIQRSETFQDLIQLREVTARIAATRPTVLRNLRVIHAGRDDGSHIANVRAVVNGLVQQGMTGLAYYDIVGNVAASGGSFTQTPEMTVVLNTPDKAELLWKDGFILRHRIPLRDATGVLGMVMTEQQLPILTRFTQGVLGDSATGDMGLCVLRDEQIQIQCFPQRLNPKAFTTALTGKSGTLLPMARALLYGESGTIIAEDYREQNVVASFGPIGGLGLGMVIKIDAVEIFQPIREQMEIALGLMLLLVVGGTLLLRSQVRPLATQLVDAQNRARSQERRFKGLLESAPDAIVIVNQNSDIVLVNTQTEKLFGYARIELLGKKIELLLPECSNLFFTDQEASLIVVGLELHARRKDGGEFPVEISLSRQDAEEGVLISVAIRDITDRRQAEEALKINTKNLEASNKELESFSYSVSHDLRAPLRGIDGFSHVLLEDYAERLDEGGRNALQRIRAASQHMGLLIDDMLALSQVTRRDIHLTQTDLSEMAASIVADLREAEPQRKVEFILAPGLVAETDAQLVRIALNNLLGNAWKFSGRLPHARIEFGITDHNGEQVYFVSDNGAGFDMTYATKLFGAFQRMHGVKDFNGTGIGLATVRRILDRLGGKIWAVSAPDQGATFYFTLAEGGRL